MKAFIFVVCLMSSSLVLAWGGSTSCGTGNPASAFCIEIGGVVSIENDENGGQRGVCEIEEWTLYREMQKRGVQPRELRSNRRVMMPNPASVNCVKSGGQLKIVRGADGEYGVCRIDEWTLWRLFNNQEQR